MGLFSGRKKEKEELPDFGLNKSKDVAGLGDLGSGLGDESGLELESLKTNNADSFGNPSPKLRNQEFERPEPRKDDFKKDMELIMAKLDTIRAEIASLNHKVENLERSQKEKKYPWQQ